MFVTDAMIEEMQTRFGVPAEASFAYEVTEREFNRIRASQKHDRNHDVTLYIRKDDKIVVIAKPFYPEALYRAPSGGLQPGESFDDGIKREMAEETGIDIDVDRFILKTKVRFTWGGQSIEWRSFVFAADYVTGEFEWTDTDEIREVRLARWDEFDTFGEMMRQSEIGGLHYRADLHDRVKELLAGP
jgi:8-oxo-dGTP pyrophosphatase MutT (NUDIX family)